MTTSKIHTCGACADEDEINFVEIARNLSRRCCFGGQTREFYSEAERSVRLAGLMPQYKLYGLLRDVYKAILDDDFGERAGTRVAVAAIDAKIYDQLGLIPLRRHPAKPLLEWAEGLLLVTEHRDVIKGITQRWRPYHEHVVPLYFKVEPWAAEQAEWRWLFELGDALGCAGIDIPNNVREYLKSDPHAPDYARPVSRGEIRGFGLKDKVTTTSKCK